MSFGQGAVGQTRVIIPTYNAEKYLDSLLPAIATQGLRHDQILVIDSSSSDKTVQRFHEFGARIQVIPQAQFDHGGTRRLAASLCPDASFLILLTQDAIPASNAFVRILDAFENQQVGMAYGRQLPRPQARAIERHARLTNYPAHSSETRRLEDRVRLGVKTIFCSDSFAAYRFSALQKVGGFPESAFFAEDQIVAARMLMANWSISYCADSEVVHSHAYTLKQDFQRNFDVGIFHSRNSWILDTFGSAEGAGLKFISSELRYLLVHAPLSIPNALLRTIAKYLGYRLGKMESSLTLERKAQLSMSPYYWKNELRAIQNKK